MHRVLSKYIFPVKLVPIFDDCCVEMDIKGNKILEISTEVEYTFECRDKYHDDLVEACRVNVSSN
jgi:hypothetical protein